MRALIAELAIILTMLASCAGDGVEKYVPPTPGPTPIPTEEVVYHKRAMEQFELINTYYRINSGATEGLYNENYPKKDGDNPASYLWPYDGLISGVATLYALGYDVEYEKMVDKFDLYYRSSSNSVNIGGYSSATDGSNGYGTRYYDDNSIVGIDLVEAYNLTKDEKYLTKASQIVAFLESGEDDIFGGGLWWNEDEKNIQGNENSNKPSCANGYAVQFLLNYYSVCPQAEKTAVLSFAKRLYEWAYENLRDPEDGCYWNDKQVSGSIRKVKYTYNTGVMISNGVRLYKNTGDKSYLTAATESAEGAYNYFVRPLNGLALSYPDHDPWFTTKLIRAFIDIEPFYKNAGNYISTFIDFMDYAYKNARLSNGLYYEDWTGAETKRSEQLLMQDAALESLGIIALYKGESITE